MFWRALEEGRFGSKEGLQIEVNLVLKNHTAIWEYRIGALLKGRTEVRRDRGF